MNTTAGQVSGDAAGGVVFDFGEVFSSVVQAPEYTAIGVDDAAQGACAVTLQPDGVVVAVAIGDDLALGVVVDPVASPVDPAKAPGVGLRGECDASAGKLGVEGGGSVDRELLDGSLFQNAAVVEGVAPAFAQVEFVDASDAFAVPKAAAARQAGTGAQAGVVDADPTGGRVVLSGFAHLAVEGGAAQCDQRGGFGKAA